MDSPVHTTVDHKRIVTDELGIYVDGEGKMPIGSYEKLNTGAAWALMEGHCGYAFPWGGEVSVQRYTSESANNQDFFEIGIDHGKNPTDATYAYAILPYASQEKIDTYAKNPDVEIIANNKSVQAVRERGLNISCFAFYEAADVAGVCVDGSCLITLTADTVCVSDPTHELERLVVVLDKELKIVNKAPNMQVLVSGGRTEMSIDLKAANGRKFEIRYKEVQNV
jgi:hyaluronate lyase